MRVIRIFVQRLSSVFRRKRAEDELHRELSLHLGQLTRENIARGMNESEARLEARREFGQLALIEDTCRDTRRVNWLEDRWRDLQHALRQRRREKAFATFAILTLAFGIGAVTTIFSLVDTALLKPLALKRSRTAVCGLRIIAQTGASDPPSARERIVLPVLARTVPVL